MPTIILLFILTISFIGHAIAQNAVCNGNDQLISTDTNGDVNCQANWGTYTKDSQATQDAKTQAQSALQAQQQSDQQTQQIIQQEIQNLGIQQALTDGVISQDVADAQTAQLTTLNTAVSATKGGQVNGT